MGVSEGASPPQAKKFVEEHCGGKVVYGDSVPGYTPVVVRIKIQSSPCLGCLGCLGCMGCIGCLGCLGCIGCMGRAAAAPRVAVLPIDEIDQHVAVLRGWHDCGGGKQALELAPGAADALDDKGWTPLLRVIRHAPPDGKRIVEVVTGRGLVHATDEHSLLAPDGTPVAASEVRTGDALMHSSLGPPHASVASNGCAQGVAADREWRLTAERGVHVLWDDLHPTFDDVVQRFRSTLVVFAETAGAAGAAGTAGDSAELQLTMPFTTHGQHLRAAQLAFAASACAGLGVRVAVAEAAAALGGEDGVRRHLHLHLTRGELGGASAAAAAAAAAAAVGAPTLVREERQAGEPVYDLTTGSHRFQAGVGALIVHNTDSIFVVFDNKGAAGRDALASSIRQGQATSAGIKPQLAPPHNLEYEKTMFPLLLLSKKRYVGLLYTDDPDEPRPKQKSMGIALKRRDYAPVVKVVYGGTIEIILRQRDVPQVTFSLGARERAKLAPSDPSKSLTKIPRNPGRSPRNPGRTPRNPGRSPRDPGRSSRDPGRSPVRKLPEAP